MRKLKVDFFFFLLISIDRVGWIKFWEKFGENKGAEFCEETQIPGEQDVPRHLVA